MKIEKICKNNEIIKIKYIETSVKIYKSSFPNHFTFNSLNINKNKNNLYKELARLSQYRHSYKTIYFHLYKGGDLFIVCFILLCLCGKREKWMRKNSKVIDTNYYHENDITMKKTLSSLRVDEKTITNMQMAIKKHNEKNIVFLNLNGFRRLSYELLSQLILQDKEIPIKLHS
jgi:hypothetical protein